MFRGLINDAKSAAGAMIAKYLARASVAVPFLVALGFGTAALAVMLVERFGSAYAYLMLAGDRKSELGPLLFWNGDTGNLFLNDWGLIRVQNCASCRIAMAFQDFRYRFFHPLTMCFQFSRRVWAD